MFDPWTITLIALLGIITGTLGGMLGVGGSIIMIPVMVIMFGQNKHPGFNQHLYQAAAMIVNVFVLTPAVIRHIKAKAVMTDVVKRILPFALLFIFVGVAASNLTMFSPDHQWRGATGPTWLGRIMASFLVYVIYVNIRRLFVKRKETQSDQHLSIPRCGFVGSVMGFIAGLMGVGGGAIATPLQQTLLHLRLKNCIANSTAIIIVTATFGAIYKNATLAQHSLNWIDSITLAALLAPTAILGGLLGGKLTHLLPAKIIRIAFICLMIAAAWKMMGLTIGGS